MAKRFTDSTKFEKKWYRKLSCRNKCIWEYLLSKCDHAGILKIDFELMTFCVGEEIKEDEFYQLFKNKFNIIKKDKIFISSFIEFQYGILKENNRAHLSVINILKKEGLYKLLIGTFQGDKEKDMDKVKVKVKDKDKDINNIILFWNKLNGVKKCNAMNEVAIKKALVENIIDDEELFLAMKNYEAVLNDDVCFEGYTKNPYLLRFLEPRKLEPFLSQNFNIQDFYPADCKTTGYKKLLT